MRRLTGKKL